MMHLGKRKMKFKVGIIGMGKVGSTIANSMVYLKPVTHIFVADIDKVKIRTEIEELKSVDLLINRYNKEIAIKPYQFIGKESDIIFIACGQARKSSKVVENEIYRKNNKIISDIIKKTGTTSNIYIVTNPSERLARDFNVNELGSRLTQIRKNGHLKNGSWILDRKGYTNWGIAAESYMVVRRAVTLKRRINYFKRRNYADSNINNENIG